jgi:hypothetical protein
MRNDMCFTTVRPNPPMCCPSKCAPRGGCCN